MRAQCAVLLRLTLHLCARASAATKRNRLIADAELSYAACAEAKLVELYGRNYRDRIASARKERDNKIARVE